MQMKGIIYTVFHTLLAREQASKQNAQLSICFTLMCCLTVGAERNLMNLNFSFFFIVFIFFSPSLCKHRKHSSTERPGLLLHWWPVNGCTVIDIEVLKPHLFLVHSKLLTHPRERMQGCYSMMQLTLIFTLIEFLPRMVLQMATLWIVSLGEKAPLYEFNASWFIFFCLFKKHGYSDSLCYSGDILLSFSFNMNSWRSVSNTSQLTYVSMFFFSVVWVWFSIVDFLIHHPSPW